MSADIVDKADIARRILDVAKVLLQPLPAAPRQKVCPTCASGKTAGHDHITVRGVGWTVNDALNNAIDEVQSEQGDRYEFREVLKTKQIKIPKKATRVKIEKKTVKKGPVKKVFRIGEDYGGQNSALRTDRRFNKEYDKQGEVLKSAKELALEYGVPLQIKLMAYCVGNTELARLQPTGAQMGEWDFTMDFHM